MERYFKFDNYNTWYDWHLILTSKSVSPPEPKTDLVEIDGMSGSLDLSEALTGEVTYHDREVSATFWTDHGKRSDRERLLSDIITSLHGRKIKIVEPDDPDHYFYGRVSVIPGVSNLAYMEFTIRAVCEPWRYAIEETVRTVQLGQDEALDDFIDVIIRYEGIKSVCPEVIVTRQLNLMLGGEEYGFKAGTYYFTNFVLKHGVNHIAVWGYGEVSFKYREATL